jgi:hypothetical protein
MLQKDLQFKDVIIICYNRQNTVKVLAKCHLFLHGTFKRKLWILFVVVVGAYVLN